MANTAALATVYNHYMSTYASKTSSPYDTHKKSELRRVYNSIIKQNSTEPLAIIDQSDKTRNFAVGIKESALSLRNTIASISGMDIDSLVSKRIASSSNPDIATAKYIGKDSAGTENVPFTIEVMDLAAPQINTGNYLPESEMNFRSGTYSFDVSINDLNYEFQYSINENETNKNVQDRLSRLLNNANIGVTSYVNEDGNGNSALVIESKTTGATSNGNPIFSITDDKTSKRKGSVAYFGLNQTTTDSRGATFKLNEQLQLTSANSFTVEKAYEITLAGVSRFEGDTATINLKKNSDSLIDNIQTLAKGYNQFIEQTSSYLDSNPKTNRILSSMSDIGDLYKNELDSLGILFDDNGNIRIDQKLLSSSAEEEDLNMTFESLKNFTMTTLNKINQIALNPMEYTNKTIVAYKNPAKPVQSPYTQSAYSGMLFNSYC